MEAALCVLPAATAASLRRWSAQGQRDQQPEEAVEEAGAWRLSGAAAELDEPESSPPSSSSSAAPGLRCAGRSAGRELKLGGQPCAGGALAELASTAWSSVLCSQRGGDTEIEDAEAEARARWEHIAALEEVGRFCAAWTATRTEPLPKELEGLSRRCASFDADAVAAALAAQLAVVDEDGDCVEWQQHLRALHSINYFFTRGGAERSAAETALIESKQLLHHLATEVPQCRCEAQRSLSLLSGSQDPDEVENAEASEPPTLFAFPKPWMCGAQKPPVALGDAGDIEAEGVCESTPGAPIPCLEAPRRGKMPYALDVFAPSTGASQPKAGKMPYAFDVFAPSLGASRPKAGIESEASSDTASTADSMEAYSALAGLHFHDADITLWPSVEDSRSSSPASLSPNSMEANEDLDAQDAANAEKSLGFHWLDASLVTSAVPDLPDPFAFVRAELDGFEGL